MNMELFWLQNVIFISWTLSVQGLQTTTKTPSSILKINHYIPNSQQHEDLSTINHHQRIKNISKINQNLYRPSNKIKPSIETTTNAPNADYYWKSEHSGAGFRYPTHESVNVLRNGRTWRHNVSLANSKEDSSLPENPVGLKDPSLLTGLWEETPDVRETKAFFRGENGSVTSAQIGTTANISCIVLSRADHETVSWIRLRDHHLITVGRQTYSNDDRFSVSFNRHQNEWTLHVRYAQPRDAGRYLCQLSTHPPLVMVKTLTVTVALATIEGGPERIVEGGSVVNISCILREHSQKPEYVFWFHNRTMINFDTNRKVKVETTKNGSTLTLADVSLRDSGNYTCAPDKALQASIMLHVIRDDAPAAIQISCASLRPGNSYVPVLIISIFTSIFSFISS